jgi:hypothetical protein
VLSSTISIDFADASNYESKLILHKVFQGQGAKIKVFNRGEKCNIFDDPIEDSVERAPKKDRCSEGCIWCICFYIKEKY